MCKTRYEWTLIDFATWFAGAVLVPVYETSSPTQVKWNLADSGAIALIVETPDHFARFDEVHPSCPRSATSGRSTSATSTSSRRRAPRSPMTRSSGGATSPSAPTSRRSSTPPAPRASPRAACSRTPTSSSSAATRPWRSRRSCPNPARRRCSSSPPRTSSRASSPCSRCTPACASGTSPTRSSSSLARQLQADLPPRGAARVREGLQRVRAEGRGRRQGQDLPRAADTAVAYSTAKEAGKVPLGLGKFTLFDRLVYGKLRHAMGGNVKYAVSGSAPLGPRLGHFYHALGITILEEYGLTETTAPATVNLATKSKIGTVGPRSRASRSASPTTARSRSRASTSSRSTGRTPRPPPRPSTATGSRRATSGRSTATASSRSPVARRRSSSRRAARTWPPPLSRPIRANPLVGQVVVVGDEARSSRRSSRSTPRCCRCGSTTTTRTRA